MQKRDISSELKKADGPVTFGYDATHECHTPTELLTYACLAEKAGFDIVWTSDHFEPWAHTGASGGFAWVWMASAAERTKNVLLGTAVTTPTLRYNPAIVAQAFATLGYMYEGRIILGVGSGEAFNEFSVGCPWPSPRERIERLEEAIKVIKLLLNEEFVDFEGKYYHLRKANLYTKPRKRLPIYVATSGKRGAEIAGKYADGLIYPLSDPRRPETQRIFKDDIWPSVERGAKAMERDPSQIAKAVSYYVCYAKDPKKAAEACRFWAGTVAPLPQKGIDISDPREIERMANAFDWNKIADGFFISGNYEEHIKRMEEYIRLGFNHILLASTSPDEREFLRVYRRKVIPYLKETYVK